VFGGPEFDCVPTLIETRRQVVAALANGRITVFCTQEQIDAAFALLIEKLLLPAADTNGAWLLSEKTPLNARYFAELLALLPRCHAIHIVRDPRAVIASLLNVGRRGRARNQVMPLTTLDVHAAIEFTRQTVDAGFHAQHICPERTLTLTYEAFVTQAEHEERRLCAFLGLEFEPAMLEPHAKGHPAQVDLVKLDNGVWLDPQLGYREIESSRIDVWRRDLDATQVAAINAAFRDHPGYRRLGYQFD
jgi:hypothetical protein